MNEELHKEMALQLSCPQGEKAISYGDEMYRAHKFLIEKSIDLMELNNELKILEIGFGAAKHLDYIFQNNPTLSYYGLEVSAEMIEYSLQISQKLERESQIHLSLYDGNKITFEDNIFDRLLSINSLYFWKDADLMFQEMNRVLKNNALLVLGTINAETLKKAPFTKYSFNYYSKQEIINLMTKSGFANVEVKTFYDNLSGINGKEITRTLDVYLGRKTNLIF